MLRMSTEGPFGLFARLEICFPASLSLPCRNLLMCLGLLRSWPWAREVPRLPSRRPQGRVQKEKRKKKKQAMELDACVSNDHRHLEPHLTIRLGVLPLSLLLKWEFSRLYSSQQGTLF